METTAIKCKIAILYNDDELVTSLNSEISLNFASNVTGYELESIHCFSNGKDFINHLQTDATFDILILDLNDNEFDVFKVIECSNEFCQNMNIIIYSSSINPYLLKKLKSFSVNGLISKLDNIEWLLLSIHTTLQNCYIASPFYTSLLENLRTSLKSQSSYLANSTNLNIFNSLSFKEYEILDLKIKGMLEKEIADFLDISISTVKFHKRNIKLKFGAKSSTELLNKVKELKW